jgi:histidinol dehydrogenase
MKQVVWQELDSDAREALLRRPALVQDERLQTEVARILDRVRRHGDLALTELTRELDGLEISALEVTDDEFVAAEDGVNSRQREALAAAAANIRAFHEAQLPFASECLVRYGASGSTCRLEVHPSPPLL